MKTRFLPLVAFLAIAGVLAAAAPAPNGPGAPVPPGAIPLAGGAAPAGAPRGAGAGPAGAGARGAAARGAPMIKMDESATDPIVRVDQQWSGRHTANLARAKQGNVDLYMLGDSITDNWGGGNVNGGAGQFAESWKKYVAGWTAANFGIGGDRTEHVLWRIKNGELDGLKPKAIVLLIGTNNLPASQYNYNPVPPAEAAQGVKLILDVIKEKQPQARVLLVSVFPRADQEQAVINDRVQALNALLARFADDKQVKYLDIYNKFLGPDGKLLPGVMQNDNLHPSAAGYDIWGQAMLPILTEWLGAPKPPN